MQTLGWDAASILGAGRRTGVRHAGGEATAAAYLSTSAVQRPARRRHGRGPEIIAVFLTTLCSCTRFLLYSHIAFHYRILNSPFSPSLPLVICAFTAHLIPYTLHCFAPLVHHGPFRDFGGDDQSRAGSGEAGAASHEPAKRGSRPREDSPRGHIPRAGHAR